MSIVFDDLAMKKAGNRYLHEKKQQLFRNVFHGLYFSAQFINFSLHGN